MAPDAGPTPTPPARAIEVSADVAPLFVAYRDGSNDWQRASVVTPTRYSFDVTGSSYLVTIVCESEADHTLQIVQLGRTDKDDTKLAAPCRSSAELNDLPGTMVQAGVVQLDDASAIAAAGEPFTLHAALGTHDLIASTSDRIVVRRELSITAGQQAAIPDIDLTSEGKDLVPVALTVKGAADGETLRAQVTLVTPTTAAGAPIFHGAVAGVKVAPDDALGDDDVQTVAVLAASGPAQRSLRRAFRVGSDTTFELPAAIEGAHWELMSDQLVASWTKLPAADSLVARVAGVTSDASQHAVQTIDLSGGFVEASGVTSAVFDTAIPGYHADWKVDPARGHTRTLATSHANKDDVATSAFTESLASAPSAR